MESEDSQTLISDLPLSTFFNLNIITKIKEFSILFKMSFNFYIFKNVPITYVNEFDNYRIPKLPG